RAALSGSPAASSASPSATSAITSPGASSCQSNAARNAALPPSDAIVSITARNRPDHGLLRSGYISSIEGARSGGGGGVCRWALPFTSVGGGDASSTLSDGANWSGYVTVTGELGA